MRTFEHLIPKEYEQIMDNEVTPISTKWLTEDTSKPLVQQLVKFVFNQINESARVEEWPKQWHREVNKNLRYHCEEESFPTL